MDGAPVPKTLRQIERELEAELSDRRREFEQAARFLREQTMAINEIPPQDGIVRLNSARQRSEQTYADYREALRRFTEFVTHGTVPPEDSEPADAASA